MEKRPYEPCQDSLEACLAAAEADQAAMRKAAVDCKAAYMVAKVSARLYVVLRTDLASEDYSWSYAMGQMVRVYSATPVTRPLIWGSALYAYGQLANGCPPESLRDSFKPKAPTRKGGYYTQDKANLAEPSES